MPVADHAVHPSTKTGADHRYGCNGKPRPTPNTAYFAPSGHSFSSINPCIARVRLGIVIHVMSTECRYDMSTTDTRCDGCEHRGSGERYAEAERLRALGM